MTIIAPIIALFIGTLAPVADAPQQVEAVQTVVITSEGVSGSSL